MSNDSEYIAPRLGGIGEQIALKVRQRIYIKMMANLNPQSSWKIIDLGVTSDQSADSNFFEKLYPFKKNITAVGLESASFLETLYPGLKFILADAKELPFKNKEFDLAFCSAVIEHVGSRREQKRLIKESCRVAHISVFTTPNRFFPLEFHTLTPLIHWFPMRLFRFFLKITGRSFFSREENLNLLSEYSFETMLNDLNLSYTKHHIRLLGFKSNLVYYVYSK